MVSFQCDGCGDVVTRKKLDSHLQRCRYPPITCIDCHKTFHGNQHKSHTSCMTEAQKYEGPQRQQNGRNIKQPRNGPNSNYKPPSVDQPTEVTPRGMQVAKVNVPPPAPSPPQSQPTPLNVFDFLVEDNKTADASDSSAPSSPISPITRRISQSSISSADESSRPPTRNSAPKDLGISYGDGPISHSLQRYQSDVSLAMDVDSQPSQSLARTPGPRQVQDLKNGTRSASDKKRKRPEVDDLDLSDDKKQDKAGDRYASLHTGLTGGLGKLLSRSEFPATEASPLSPKKRSKHSKHSEESRREDRDERKHRSSKSQDDRKKFVRRRGEDGRSRQLAIEGSSKPKAIMNGNPSRKSFASHSEFFVSLIDKDYKSQKGQSIWGALKTFHEGVCPDDDLEEYDAEGQRQREEKRLLKALRVKRNKQGEIVLFARPDFEEEEVTSVVRRIEAP